MTLTSTMDALIQQFASCFTKPSFKTFCVIVTGWLLGSGRRRVTHILLAGDGLKVKTFSCYHRFFSQARWTVDAVGRVMLRRCVSEPRVVARGPRCNSNIAL